VAPMTEDELQARLEKTTPARDRYELFVEEAQDQDVRVRFSPGAGEGWSMAALLTVAETSLRAAAGVEAAITHLTVTRLREAQPADVIALSRVIRRDGEVVHAEAWLFSHAVIEAILHATATLRTADLQVRS
jgi:acyl-coenzyme A thioesterase PaaI-like protein